MVQLFFKNAAINLLMALSTIY
ncbi:unnamed protein product [Chondrus crispus]|uniref:Uncharacterized protein n=1 Tax=Chondrus crispus TaxID=2769 RepID=R7QDJ7_CHOCR|nr:unnamed protein product [Chondrus crispus]CDF35858.1 unnamed protein product [Chondrus crispus]|eukprot:XP_005715677.1 unnamed protein product [Chondrus crispus]